MKTNMTITLQIFMQCQELVKMQENHILYFYQCAGDFFHTLHSALCAPAQFSLMDLCQCCCWLAEDVQI
jgi:hypothetical protein